jgi:hypothetical protein
MLMATFRSSRFGGLGRHGSFDAGPLTATLHGRYA